MTQRIMKFRVWLKEEKEMRFDRFVINPVQQVENENGIIMQFTGLYDKNGKEIYEGDIITEAVQNEFGSYAKDKPLEVYFNSVIGAFRAQDKSDKIHDWSIGKNCEVIGNIYENPELLAPLP